MSRKSLGDIRKNVRKILDTTIQTASIEFSDIYFD